MSAPRVRRAREVDAEAIAALMTQLGYPSDASQLSMRLRRAAADPDACALVAEQGGCVVGMIGLMVFHSFVHDQPHGYITSLVVDESVRGAGTGSTLLAAGEAWFEERGTDKATLTSHLRREAAHRFYERRGYEFNGRRYVKSLV
ncbi:MAG TPA: GNAT family N-acetyltransferase [Gammaproteobacteria bacterium]|nr:GNAT family N-acetyltransferase [Gammaproteobacteria bacterium]